MTFFQFAVNQYEGVSLLRLSSVRNYMLDDAQRPVTAKQLTPKQKQATAKG